MKHETIKLFRALKQHVLILHFDWLVFREVFDSPQNINLLNATAPGVFQLLHNSFADHVALALSRLTDPAKTRQAENLTLRRLIDSASLESKSLGDQLEAQLKHIEASVEKFRKHRNKRIAHIDLEHTMSSQDQLERYTMDDINLSLASIAKFMNIFETAWTRRTTVYEEAILPRGYGGESLIPVLKKALAYNAIEAEGIVERGFWRRFT